jgi:hypothetical protein
MVPYLACKSLSLPDLASFIDVSLERLQALKDACVPDPDAPGDEDEADEEVSGDDESLGGPDAHQFFLCASSPQLTTPDLTTIPILAGSSPVPAVVVTDSPAEVTQIAASWAVTVDNEEGNVDAPPLHPSNLAPNCGVLGNPAARRGSPLIKMYLVSDLTDRSHLSPPVLLHFTYRPLTTSVHHVVCTPGPYVRRPSTVSHLPPPTSDPRSHLLTLVMNGVVPTRGPCTVAGGYSPTLAVSATVNGTEPLHCLLDTGSSLCLISETAAQRCLLAIDRNLTLTVPAPTGADVSITGLATNVPISLDTRAFVVDHLVIDVILGQPFFVLAEAALTYQHTGTINFEVTQPGDLCRWQIPTSPVPSPWDTNEPSGSTYYTSRIVAEVPMEEDDLRFRITPRPCRRTPRCTLQDRLSDSPFCECGEQTHRFGVCGVTGHFDQDRRSCPHTCAVPDQGWSVVQ